MLKILFKSTLLLLLLIGMSGCNLVNVMRMKYANDDVVPVWKGKESQKELKLEFIGDKPYMRARINDQQELLLLIDTGASFTALFKSESIQGLDFKRGFEFDIGGWGDDGDSNAFQTTLTSLSFADITYHEFNVAIIPIDKTPYFKVKEEMVFDGVIGHDILRHFVWTFNHQQEKITIANKPHQKKADESYIPFETSFGKISIPAKVNLGDGNVVDRDVIIDTGSRHYFKLSTAFIKNNDSTLGTKITAADFGLSGRTKHHRVTLPSLTLGQNNYPNVKTNLIKSDDEDDWWVIGNALLSLSEYTIDYLESKLFISSVGRLKHTSRYNLLGLELRKLTTGNFIVRYVFPELPASKVNIGEGAIIAKINGKNSNEISEDEWLNITNTVGIHEVCNLANSCWKISAKQIQGYSPP